MRLSAMTSATKLVSSAPMLLPPAKSFASTLPLHSCVSSLGTQCRRTVEAVYVTGRGTALTAVLSPPNNDGVNRLSRRL